jgi:hypothetical protein
LRSVISNLYLHLAEGEGGEAALAVEQGLEVPPPVGEIGDAFESVANPGIGPKLLWGVPEELPR